MHCIVEMFKMSGVLVYEIGALSKEKEIYNEKHIYEGNCIPVVGRTYI